MKAFWKSPVYRMIKLMSGTGNGVGLIEHWYDQVKVWAESNPDHKEAKILQSSLAFQRNVDFHTVLELRELLPALSLAFAGEGVVKMSAMRLAFNLDFGGLPKLKNLNGSYIFYDLWGDEQEYYITANVHKWRYKRLTQKEFERAYYY